MPMVKIMAPISFNNYRAVHHKVRGGCVFDFFSFFFFWPSMKIYCCTSIKEGELRGKKKKKKKEKKKNDRRMSVPVGGASFMLCL